MCLTCSVWNWVYPTCGYRKYFQYFDSSKKYPSRRTSITVHSLNSETTQLLRSAVLTVEWVRRVTSTNTHKLKHSMNCLSELAYINLSIHAVCGSDSRWSPCLASYIATNGMQTANCEKIIISKSMSVRSIVSLIKMVVLNLILHDKVTPLSELVVPDIVCRRIRSRSLSTHISSYGNSLQGHAMPVVGGIPIPN